MLIGRYGILKKQVFRHLPEIIQPWVELGHFLKKLEGPVKQCCQ